MNPDWVAVDWGTSNLRAWPMDCDGNRLAMADSGRGMARLTKNEYEPALLDLIGNWLPEGVQTDVIVCGMAGAKTGWCEAPYRNAPCSPLSVDEAVMPSCADRRMHVHILPGIKTDLPQPDVMRGEETLVAGLLAKDPGFEGVACMPGTHTKWIEIRQGQVASFQTHMSGEVFELLCTHSVLRHSIDRNASDEAEFASAFDSIISRPETLSRQLFGIRASSLVAGLSPAGAASRLSGLLIGAEMAAAKPYWLGRDIAIVGTSEVAAVYARAMRIVGAAPEVVASTEMACSGLAAARNQM